MPVRVIWNVWRLADQASPPREPFKNAPQCRIGQSGKGDVDVLTWFCNPSAATLRTFLMTTRTACPGRPSPH